MSEASDEAHFAAALVTISAAIGWKARIVWAENAEPCTVNAILEGGSATARKTTVAHTAQGLVRLAYDGYPPEDRGLSVQSIGHTSDRGLLEVVAPKDVEEAAGWEKTPPPGVALIWDEFGSVLGAPGDAKGSDWMGRVRSTLMQISNGRHSGIRISGMTRPGSRCAVGILATMTRVELEQRVSHGLLRDGFLGRFCMIPHNGRPRYLAVPPVITPEQEASRQRLAEWLRDLSQSREEISVFEHLDDEAVKLRTHWYTKTSEELDRRCRDEASELNTAMMEAFGRVQTVAIKIAAISAICDQYNPPLHSLGSITIRKTDVQYGIQFAYLLMKEIKNLAESASDSLDEEYCHKIVAYLQRKGGSASRKDLLDNVRGRGLNRQQKWGAVLSLFPDDVDIREEMTTGRAREVVTLRS